MGYYVFSQASICLYIELDKDKGRKVFMATGNQNRGNQRSRTSNSANNRSRGGSSNSSRSGGTRSRSSNNRTYKKQRSPRHNEIMIYIYLAVCIFLMCSSFGWCGVIGKYVSMFVFGLTGSIAYLLPVYLFLSAAFLLSNGVQKEIVKRVLCVGIFLIAIAFVCQLVNGTDGMTAKSLYMQGATAKRGGGFVLGGILVLLHKLIGFTGCVIVTVLLTIIGIIIVVDISFIEMVKNRVRYEDEEDDDYDDFEFDPKHRKRDNRDVLGSIRVLEPENSKKTKTKKQTKKVDEEDVHELKPLPPEDIFESGLFEINDGVLAPDNTSDDLEEFEEITAPETKRRRKKTKESTSEMLAERDQIADILSESNVSVATASAAEATRYKDMKSDFSVDTRSRVSNAVKPAAEQPVKQEEEVLEVDSAVGETKEYKFPPLSLLRTQKVKAGNSEASVRETAIKLRDTLKNFGVNVTITNYSFGPSVTRYELQPEQGVKVSKIVNLADDIKLNLAAADIRIEAPIPGKAAIGIEVPNKESQMVYFRDLLESDTFQKHPSNIAFAVGKDIGGQTIVADIAKMPHLLIAGQTGSGKSVCINTLIMSIIYKAKPDDVKLIMIDPKQVELSIYNKTPHMLIPVVTDAKKAAGALNWGVLEMTNRYQLFAQYNVRNLQGYNEKVKQITGTEEGNEELKKLPQIIIIVDELADLMMVAHGEVEDAIVRLSQLARAAGIHLVIATQRPSVDVITGLIKANVPSRIAMSVASGVDSRTILDMNGAEKLLGNGDMLFYPTGSQKPARVQGAYLSDEEIENVVEFLKKQNGESNYDDKISAEISSAKVGGGSGAGGSSAAESEYDDYFADAGKFIISKEKASIGMLQRVYKIGFNRAARIMDQLSDAGVVGPEEGTKPRKVLMTMEEFENFVEENL